MRPIKIESQKDLDQVKKILFFHDVMLRNPNEPNDFKEGFVVDLNDERTKCTYRKRKVIESIKKGANGRLDTEKRDEPIIGVKTFFQTWGYLYFKDQLEKKDKLLKEKDQKIKNREEDAINFKEKLDITSEKLEEANTSLGLKDDSIEKLGVSITALEKENETLEEQAEKVGLMTGGLILVSILAIIELVIILL